MNNETNPNSATPNADSEHLLHDIEVDYDMPMSLADAIHVAAKRMGAATPGHVGHIRLSSGPAMDSLACSITHVTTWRDPPGWRAVRLADGRLDAEDIACLLAPKALTAAESVAALGRLAATLRSDAFITSIFNRLFPNRTATLRSGSIVLTPKDVSDAVGATLGAEASTLTNHATIVAELLCYVLTVAKLMVPPAGLIAPDVRGGYVPGREDLLREAVRHDIREHLMSQDYRLTPSASYTPAALGVMVSQLLSRLGMRLSDLSWSYMRVASGLALVRRRMAHDYASFDPAVAAVASHPALLAMCADATLLQASLEEDALDEGLLVDGYAYTAALDHTTMVLNASPRLLRRTAAEFAASWSVKRALDVRDNVVAVLAAYAVKPSGLRQAGQLIAGPDNTQDFSRDVLAEKALAQTVGTVVTENTHWAAMEALAQLASQVSGEQVPGAVMPTTVISLTADARLLTAYALCAAESVWLDVVARTFTYRTVARGRLTGPALAIDGLVVTEDPLSVLACAKEGRATTVVSLASQVPTVESGHVRLLTGADDRMFVDLTRSLKLRVVAGTVKMGLDASISQILGLGVRYNLSAIKLEADDDVIDTLVDTIAVVSLGCSHLVAAQTGNTTHAGIVGRMGVHALVALINRVARVAAMDAILLRVRSALLSRLSPPERRQMLVTLTREEIDAQLRIKLALMLLVGTGAIKDATDSRVRRLLHDMDYFVHMVGAKPGDTVLA